MARQSKTKKATENVGKGKVTPVQVAFIVDRYLADNHYGNALAAFRSEAADLFSKTKGKEVPKGLLGLEEILDEYIRLKEQRIMLDQEKRRVEMAMNGLQEVMRAYQSGTAPPLPCSPPLLPPQFVGASIPLHHTHLHPNNVSPPGNMPAITYTHASTSHTIHNVSTPTANHSYTTTNNETHKRKATNLVPKAPKKSCPQPSSLPSSSNPQLVPIAGTAQENTVPLANNPIAKNLFKSDKSSKKSPETPQPNNNNNNNNNNQTVIQNSKCSIVSLMSPTKSYYSVERSYQITSPCKPSLQRSHVKGKLDFGSADLDAGLDNGLTSINENGPSNSGSSPEGGENELGNGLDFDFSDFGFLNGDLSFSELLIDLDLGCEGIPCQSQSTPDQAENIGRFDQELNGETEESKLTIEDYSEDTNIQGSDSVTSIRAITKRIQIMSPVKTRKEFSKPIIY